MRHRKLNFFNFVSGLLSTIFVLFLGFVVVYNYCLPFKSWVDTNILQTPQTELTYCDLTAETLNSSLLLTTNSNVEISTGENVLVQGEEIYLSVSAIEGYTITTLTINGQSVPNNYSFIVVGDIDINVIAVPSSYNLTLENDHTTIYFEHNGLLVPPNPEICWGISPYIVEDSITHNAIYTITAVADEGYRFISLTVNGEPFTNGSTIACVGDITVCAVAFPNIYNLNRTAENATVYYVQGETIITASEDNVILYDESFILNVVANEGYTITSILVNGIETENGATITCVGEINIVATATLKTYNLTTTGDNATINLLQGETTITAGDNVLIYGQTAILNVIANEGYQIDSILVNGVETANGATITFTENLSIEVVSSPIQTQTFDAIPEGMTFRLYDTTMTATISCYDGFESTLIIPNTISYDDISNSYISGGDYKVIGIENEAFMYSDLVSITLCENISLIGFDAFKNCCNLETIYIGSNLEEIKTNAFKDCISLTDVYFCGTAEDWALICIGHNNDFFLDATIHYNYVA